MAQEGKIVAVLRDNDGGAAAATVRRGSSRWAVGPRGGRRQLATTKKNRPCGRSLLLSVVPFGSGGLMGRVPPGDGADLV